MKDIIQFDFVEGHREKSLIGALLLVCGLVAVIAVGIDYRILTARRAGLEQRVTALNRVTDHTPSRTEIAADARDAAIVQQAAQDLSTPWTLLLAELEQASKDTTGQIALLGVEPDHGKHTVRISAEARTLALALAYVQRLQGSRSLRYPMLDRHEVRADDPQHPIRFELTGEWKDI